MATAPPPTTHAASPPHVPFYERWRALESRLVCCVRLSAERVCLHFAGWMEARSTSDRTPRSRTRARISGVPRASSLHQIRHAYVRLRLYRVTQLLYRVPRALASNARVLSWHDSTPPRRLIVTREAHLRASHLLAWVSDGSSPPPPNTRRTKRASRRSSFAQGAQGRLDRHDLSSSRSGLLIIIMPKVPSCAAASRLRTGPNGAALFASEQRK
jgi:hypothetical protein